jgi:hypothetical protein
VSGLGVVGMWLWVLETKGCDIEDSPMTHLDIPGHALTPLACFDNPWQRKGKVLQGCLTCFEKLQASMTQLLEFQHVSTFS